METHAAAADKVARRDPIEMLTGAKRSSLYPGGIGLPGSGEKFLTDGSVQTWSGNTFICHIDRTSSSFAAIQELQERIKKSQYAQFYTFLPPPSFHMTIFQGYSPGDPMPDGINDELSLEALTSLFMQRTEKLELPDKIRICATDLYTAHSLTVCGANAEQEQQMRTIRSALRDATGIQPEKFDSYVFHISLAYLLHWVSEGLAKEIVDYSNQLFKDYQAELSDIELGPIEFCTFDTMHHFQPLKMF